MVRGSGRGELRCRSPERGGSNASRTPTNNAASLRELVGVPRLVDSARSGDMPFMWTRRTMQLAIRHSCQPVVPAKAEMT